MKPICERCVLPSNFPGIRFSSENVCHYCLESNHRKDLGEIRQNVEASIQECLGKAPTYDIVLAFSGGKDSSYVLKYLTRKFEARIVAITIDNDFMSNRARENCRIVTQELGVDHIFYKPNPRLMKEIYRVSVAERELHSLSARMRASAICNSCIQVINTQIVNFAINYKIPIVAGGYIGGQVPSDTGFMRHNPETTAVSRSAMMARLGKHLSPDSLRLFRIARDPGKEIAVINPLIYLNMGEEEIISEISPLGWIRPEDTGQSSSNCLLNDFAIFEHHKNLGFHPYILEIAAMVRSGKMDRERALQRIQVPFREDDFTGIKGKISLK